MNRCRAPGSAGAQNWIAIPVEHRNRVAGSIKQVIVPKLIHRAAARPESSRGSCEAGAPADTRATAMGALSSC